MYKRFISNTKHIELITRYDKLGIPVIRKEDIELSENVVSFNNRKDGVEGLHFFIDDYQFERLWNNPEKYVDIFSSYKFITSPDYSLYTDFPIIMQIYNTYKKQFLGAYFQKKGIHVIPTVSWSDESSYSWCFLGIEKGSTVACSSVGCMNNEEYKELFIKGFEKMIEVIEPKAILMNGDLPEELKKYIPICKFIKTNQEIIRQRVAMKGARKNV